MKKAHLFTLLLSVSTLTFPLYGMIEEKEEQKIIEIKKEEKKKPVIKNWMGALTQKKLLTLIDLANKGDEDAQNTLVEKWETTNGSLKGEDLKWLTLDLIKKRLPTHQGYGDLYLFNVNDLLSKGKTDYLSIIQLSAKKDDALAQYNLGKYHRSNLHYTDAYKWLSKAAEQQYPPALYTLGLMDLNGNGVNKDFEEANILFQRAGQYPQAISTLGNSYIEGYGVTKDSLKGLMLQLQSGMSKVHGSSIIKKFLNINSYVNNMKIKGSALTSQELDTLCDNITTMRDGYDMQEKLHNPDGNFVENQFAINKIHEAYLQLSTFTQKATTIVALLKKVHTGFAVTNVTPTKDLEELLEKNPHATTISQISHNDETYMVIGEENHEIWKQYQQVTKDFDLESELEKTLQSLGMIQSVFKETGTGTLLQLRIKSLKEIGDLQEKFAEQQKACDTLRQNLPTKEEMIDAEKLLRVAEQNVTDLREKLQKEFDDKKEELKKIKHTHDLEKEMFISPDTKKVYIQFGKFVGGFFEGPELHKRNTLLANEFLPQEWEPKE